MPTDRCLAVTIVDFTGLVWSGEASFISAPAVGGPIGLYPRHQPLLALLEDGAVKVKLPDGSQVTAHLTAGFLSLDSDQVTVVADHCQLCP